MRYVGSVEEIWRYPVSSLGGERLNAMGIGTSGIDGDRTWAVVDQETSPAAAPEKDLRWRPALFLSSRLRDRLPEIGFPDALRMSVDDPQLEERLCHHFGFDVTARPYPDLKAANQDDAGFATNRYELSPLHLITTSSMEWLSRSLGTTDVTSKRFRPNLVLRTSAEPQLLEGAWLGQRLQVGTTIIEVTEETKRCGMTLIAQPGLRENPEILRTILRQNRRNFGAYCRIGTPASVSVGDPVFLVGDDAVVSE